MMDTLDSREVIEGHLEALIAEGRLISQPFERLVVADPEIHRMETELAEVLKTASQRSPHAVAEVDRLLNAEGGELNPEQRDAVRNGLGFSISLMTGGAGSGKTYAVSNSYAALYALYASRLKLTVHCDRFARMVEARRGDPRPVISAPASPTLKVRFPDGREVIYRSMEELRKAKAEIEEDIRRASGRPGGRVRFAPHQRGDGPTRPSLYDRW
jgi:hypothetical protein